MVEQTRLAAESGSQLPFRTDLEVVPDCGVRFLVRCAEFRDKDAERRRQSSLEAQGRHADPFDPYEADLFVADVGRCHIALLNKFNVIEHHLLIVTRTYEDQESLLTLEDFEALWTCMADFESLGFYNGGETAGASQRHKHLQLVPLPLACNGSAVPMEPLLTGPRASGVVAPFSALPFEHAFAGLDPDAWKRPAAAAGASLATYLQMMKAVGCLDAQSEAARRQRRPYNLLVTRSWMLLVPRSRECCEGFSVNALGYAGALLVRSREQLESVRRRGPMSVLAEVGFPPAADGLL